MTWWQRWRLNRRIRLLTVEAERAFRDRRIARFRRLRREVRALRRRRAALPVEDECPG